MSDVVDLQPKTTSPDLQQQRKMILPAVALLLSHYFLPDVPAEIKKAQARDWVDNLIEFGAELVGAACREWLREHSRRPMIADIRKQCLAIEAERQQRAAPPPVPASHRVVQLRPAPKPWISPEQERMRREGRAISDAFARRHGFADIADYEAAGGSIIDVIRGIPSVEAAPGFASAAEAVAMAMRAIEASVQSASA